MRRVVGRNAADQNEAGQRVVAQGVRNDRAGPSQHVDAVRGVSGRHVADHRAAKVGGDAAAAVVLRGVVDDSRICGGRNAAPLVVSITRGMTGLCNK